MTAALDVDRLRSALQAGRMTEQQKRALDGLLAAFAEPDPPAPVETAVAPPQMDNDEVIERYLRAGRARGWRPETIRLRKMQLRRIAAAFAPTPLIAVTEEQLLEWREQLPGKPETVASYTSAAAGLYRWMTVRARPRLRLDDPALILERPRVPAAQPRPIHNEQYDLAIACAVSDPEMYVWLGLMGCSGLRCCEVAWLRTADVEYLEDGGGYLHLTGKGGKQRTVPVGPHLMSALRVFVDAGPGGPVFPRPSDGEPHTPNAVSQRVAKFLRELNIPATAHQLRHRFAGDYHALDPDLYRQAKLMGHSSVDTTQRYTEISPVEAARHIADLTRRRLGGGGRRSSPPVVVPRERWRSGPTRAAR